LGLGDFNPRLLADTIETDGVANVMAGANTSFFMKNSVESLEISGLDRVYAGATANFRCYAVWADGRRTDVTAEVIWTDDSSTAAIELNSGILDLSAVPAGTIVRVSAGYFDVTAARDVAVVQAPLGGAVLYGSGYNSYSQLGLDTTVSYSNLMEVTTDRIISAAGGAGHSLYVREDGSVFVMGDNTYGQLGTGDTIPHTVPAQVALTRPALAVGAGDGHSLIVFRDGSLYSMGNNSQGQLGDGTQINRSSPTLIWLEGVIGVDGGAGHSVFLTADGAVWTMGRNAEGQLGTGTTNASTTPVKVHAGGATAIAAGANHTLFTTADAAMWGMGDNSRGQLGLGGSVVVQSTPTTLVAADAAHMAAGADHSTYATPSGDLYLSGANDYGQLGNGTNTRGTDVPNFTRLDFGTAVNGVYNGSNFSLFRTGTRTYTDSGPTDYIWYGTGDNSYGQLSNGTYTTAAIPVVCGYGTLVKTVWPANRHVLLTRGLPGDIDGDVQFTLHDVVLALQIMAGTHSGFNIAPYADINGDGRIGLPEAQYALRKVGGF
jgi:alpha-tubulin suppressor-like RCC1 family protein